MTTLETQDITVQCRVNRGRDGAWDEAVARLREVYDAQVDRFGPVMVLHLSISRSRAPGIADYIYDASLSSAAPVPGLPTDKDEQW